MTNQSLLAAVHAAASEPIPAAAAASQAKEIQMAEPKPAAAAPAESTKPTTVAELCAAFPELVATIRAEGAQMERNRIVGIEALGAQMKGHEQLIADMKADGKTTPEQAAVRIIGAENAARAQQLKGIKDVDTLTGKVAAAPTVDAAAGGQQQTSQAATPEAWAAEYGAQTPEGAKLRSEFASKDDYVAFMANAHKVRIFGRKSA